MSTAPAAPNLYATDTPMGKEPARIIGLTLTAVTSVIALLVAFGVPITPEAQVAILGVVAGVGPLVTYLLTRGRVWSPHSVAKVVQGEVLAARDDRVPGPDHRAGS